MGFKKGWRAFKAAKRSTQRKRSTRAGGVRKTARRAYVRKNNNPKRRSSMRKSIPHPSVTGMASGLAIAAYLNQGSTVMTGQNGFKVAKVTEGVIKDVTDGQLGTAFNTLAGNAIDMIASEGGRKTLVTASGIAILGAFARKQFPQLKLGGSKLYFRL